MRGYCVCLRLVSPELDGVWMEVAEGRSVNYLIDGQGVTTTMVATGSLEWDGDRAAEVYVPEHRLAHWRAEHDVDDR